MYTCYLYGLFSVFQASTALCIFMSTHANSWIKVAARQNIIWIRFGNRRAVRRPVEAGMALTAIGEIAQWGGVADCSGCRTACYQPNPHHATANTPGSRIQIQHFQIEMSGSSVKQSFLQIWAVYKVFCSNLSAKWREKAWNGNKLLLFSAKCVKSRLTCVKWAKFKSF